MYETKPELIGIYNNGVKGGGGGASGSVVPDGKGGLILTIPIDPSNMIGYRPISSAVVTATVNNTSETPAGSESSQNNG